MKIWIGFFLFLISPLLAEEILNGSGSLAPEALMKSLAADYKKETGAELTYQPFGREAGIRQISDRTVDFALSEKPVAKDNLADDKLVQLPFLVTSNGEITYVLLAQEKKEIHQRIQHFQTWLAGKEALLRNFGYSNLPGATRPNAP